MILFKILIVLSLFYLAGIYKSLKEKKNLIERNWTQLDIQVKNRYELISALINIIKEHTIDESNRLEEFIKSYNQALTISQENINRGCIIKENALLTDNLNNLFNIFESHASLKSNKEFLKLKKEINFTNDKINYNLALYHSLIIGYNTQITILPFSIIAKFI